MLFLNLRNTVIIFVFRPVVCFWPPFCVWPQDWLCPGIMPWPHPHWRFVLGSSWSLPQGQEPWCSVPHPLTPLMLHCTCFGVGNLEITTSLPFPPPPPVPGEGLRGKADRRAHPTMTITLALKIDGGSMRAGSQSWATPALCLVI